MEYIIAYIVLYLGCTFLSIFLFMLMIYVCWRIITWMFE